jgi:CSLREA domain-containing protein
MADRKRRFALAAIALTFLFVAMPQLARAATITVQSTLDDTNPGHCTLREAINSANGASSGTGTCTAGTGTDTIGFSVTGTITLGSTLPAIVSGETLTITGPTTTPGIKISGGNAVQLMVVNSGATLKLQSLTMEDGMVTAGLGEGGAILNSGTLTVANSTLSGNHATGGPGTSGGGGFGGEGIGGAIFNNFTGTLTVTNSTFSANQATGGTGSPDGGGVGGAIYNDILATLTVTNSTFSANVGASGGGAIYNDGTVGLKGSILADSTGGNCSGNRVTTDVGYNIADDDSCFTNGTNGSMVVSSVGLVPGEPAMNGGPTQTIALESNSQAVDFIPVASCTDQTLMPLTTDQRGFPRPDFGNPRFCDAGAYELQTTPIVVEANGERLQIARSTTPNSDKVNLAFSFIENASPTCDAGDDAFNGFNVYLATGSCASLNFGGPVLFLDGWVVHTVNRQSYGTLFFDGGGTLSARMVELPTPPAPACGEWTVNIEIAGIDSAFLGNGPFALGLRNPDGDTGCFEITNAVVGNQIPTPGHGVRRGVRR